VVTLSQKYPVQFAKPVDLQADLTADENGKAVHEHCYVQHITSSNSNPPAPMMAD
jgi:hypothetical protein